MGLGRDIAYGAFAAASSPVWGISLLRTGKWRTDWAGRFGKTQERLAKKTEKPRLLIHAVSVGETNLIRKLVAELDRRGIEVVVAVTTNTGFARAQSLYGERHTVVRYPLDFSFAVNRFLDAIAPDAVALVELEVWPNFIDACEARNLPVCVINGRLSERSFKGYTKARPFITGSFAKITAAAVQTEAIGERFVAMGTPADRVKVLDTMKWDTAEVNDTVQGADTLADELGIDRDRPVIVAGSTAPGEESLLIDALPEHVQLIIAPRKPEWFDAVMSAAPGAVRLTAQRQGKKAEADKSRAVFLLDTIGDLRKAYALADIAIVGRSFTGKLYGSDMTEPIALGKPTIVGQHTSDFRQTMEALVGAEGIVVSQEPMPEAVALLHDKARAGELARRGREVILSRQGATLRHADLLEGLLRKSQT